MIHSLPPGLTLESRLEPGFTQRPTQPGQVAGQGRLENQAEKEPKLRRDLTVDDALQMMNDRLFAKLDKIVQAEGGPPLRSLQAEDYTPDKVADRILGFVGHGLERARAEGADQDRLDKLLGQARAGIEQGFGEAKEILEGLGAFQGDVERNANQTYDLLQAGLDRLGRPPDAASAAGAELSTAISASQSRSFSLEVQTRDGDRVSINLSRESSSQHSQSLQANDGGFQFVSESRESSRSAVQFSISGELDEAEWGALRDLLGGMDRLVDHFYAGDAATALEQGQQLNYDSKALAGFSLHLQQTESRRATLAYQAVGQLNGADSAADSQSKPARQALGQLVSGLRQLLQSPAAEQMQQPGPALGELFGQRLGVDSRFPGVFGGQGGDAQARSQDLAGRLLQAAQALNSVA